MVALLGAACESTVVTVPTGDHPCGLFAVMGNDTTDAGTCTLAQGGVPNPNLMQTVPSRERWDVVSARSTRAHGHA